MLGKLIVALIALTVAVNTFAVDPSWSLRGGGPGNDSASVVRIDDVGNVFVAGYTSGTVNWGGATLQTLGFDMLLAKYDRNGAHQWSRNYGGAGTEVVTGMALDASGNLIVCGYFIGSGSVGGETWATLGAYDAFLAKYSPTGEHLWSHRYGGTMSDLFTGVVVDSGGNTVVTGYFFGTANFGGAALVSPFNSAPGTFLAKYSPAGAHLWSKTFTAGNGNYGYGIALAAGDAVVIGGSFFSWIEFGGGRLTAVAAAYQNIYLAKFDSNGTHLWSKRYGGAKGDGVTALACDATGDVLAVGKFYQSTDLGGGAVTGTAIDQDGWAAKYRGSDGSFAWGQPLNPSNGIWMESVASDPNGNPVLTGHYYGRVTFGAGSLPASNLGSYDGFVAQFSGASGSPMWSFALGSTAADAVTSCACNHAGDIALSGYFSNTLNVGTNRLTSAGSYDGLVVFVPGQTQIPPEQLTLGVSVGSGPYAPGDLVLITVTVTSNSHPMSGALVTFSAIAPVTGTTATFSATTDATGNAAWPFVIPAGSESGKWIGNATATKQGFTAASIGFTFCSCACK